MGNKRLLIITIIFFLIINTAYYWEGKLGFFAFPIFLILVVVYLGLLIILLRQIYFAIKENFTDKFRLLTIGVLTLVLVVVFFKPYGLIDFDKFEGNDVLVAQREGSANCITTLKLKDDFTFRERTVCFGMTEIKGKFHLQNDTIYFQNENISKYEDEFYKFGIVKNKDGKYNNLIRYKSLTDTVKQNELWITKNELYKLKEKKAFIK